MARQYHSGKEVPPSFPMYLPRYTSVKAREKSGRGRGFLLVLKMQLVEIFRFLRRVGGLKVNYSNFHEFVGIQVDRKSIRTWDEMYDTLQFDVFRGRAHKTNITSDVNGLLQYFVEKAVFTYLEWVRANNMTFDGR
ncbi:hypothetical protein BGW41_004104 [Actinomortierella wolfii]|nr:hypothetical protein BGW41_004104 [Actinomortierella wolfii]